ncbi:MAG: ABC transporter substrate-binding protein [Cellvibrionaceae bacterium]|nr:ABC transporter substrate-binding protein [Cellvibrionaceae bacterium]
MELAKFLGRNLSLLLLIATATALDAKSALDTKSALDAKSALAEKGAHAAKDTQQITDILGRQVTVAKDINALILGESRFIPALGIVVEDAAISRIKGMQADLKQYDPATWAIYSERFPEIEKIPLVGKGEASSFSVEKTISLMPDVALFGISGHGPSPHDKEMLNQLEAAGIPVVFIDFREAPLKHTQQSVQILGQLFGNEKAAREFDERYKKILQTVSDRVIPIPQEKRPLVFLHSKVGLFPECCETMGHTMLGTLLQAAGGRHMGAELIPGNVGNVNIEHLLARQPDKYLATAIGSAKQSGAASPFVMLGPDVSEMQARDSLQRATNATMVRNLTAVQRDDMFGIWHHFYNSPFNVTALVALAKWLHPEAFADIEPTALLADFYRDFQPVPFQGIYWVGMKPVKTAAIAALDKKATPATIATTATTATTATASLPP